MLSYPEFKSVSDLDIHRSFSLEPVSGVSDTYLGIFSLTFQKTILEGVREVALRDHPLIGMCSLWVTRD